MQQQQPEPQKQPQVHAAQANMPSVEEEAGEQEDQWVQQQVAPAAAVSVAAPAAVPAQRKAGRCLYGGVVWYNVV